MTEKRWRAEARFRDGNETRVFAIVAADTRAEAEARGEEMQYGRAHVPDLEIVVYEVPPGTPFDPHVPRPLHVGEVVTHERDDDADFTACGLPATFVKSLPPRAFDTYGSVRCPECEAARGL